MEARLAAFAFKGNRRSGSLDHTTAERLEKSFDTFPFKISINRFHPEKFEHFAVLGVHPMNDSTCRQLCKQVRYCGAPVDLLKPVQQKKTS